MFMTAFAKAFTIAFMRLFTARISRIRAKLGRVHACVHAVFIRNAVSDAAFAQERACRSHILPLEPGRKCLLPAKQHQSPIFQPNFLFHTVNTGVNRAPF